MATIGIVILNYNGIADTRECLRSLETVTFAGGSYFTVVVDYSKDATQHRQLQAEFPSIYMIREEENLGFAGGNNAGIRYALEQNADAVLLLNNDTVVTADFLNQLWQFLQNHPKAGIVSPKIYFAKGYEYHKQRYSLEDQGRVIWYAGGLIDWKNVYGSHRGVDAVDTGQYDQPIQTEFMSGCCCLIRRGIFLQIGLLDEQLFLYWEDSDFSMRAKKAGWEIWYCPDAFIWHKNAGSSGVGSGLHDYFLQRNRLVFGWRYAPFRTRLALIKQSLLQWRKSSGWTQKAIQDAYLGKMGKGSWQG